MSGDAPAGQPELWDYDTDWIGNIAADVPSEDEKDRLRRLVASRPILRWAAREALVLYEGAPGRKHPLKNFYEEGWSFRPWPGTGTALARIPADMVILDADTAEGIAAVTAMDLPPHFAIRSLASGGEKHFFRCDDPPRRMIRALPGLDVLANPDNKYCWAKLDSGDDGGGYEIISDNEDVPDLPDEVLAALLEAKSSGAIIANSGTRTGRTRQVSTGARWDDDDELLPTEHYAEHGIPLGLQEDRFYRLADRFAALGMSEDKGTGLLTAIARVSEQKDSDPWTPDQLKEKMTRAIAWVATLPPRQAHARADDAAEVDGLVVPDPLTDAATPWLPKDPAAASTGLDYDGRVPMKGDAKSDDNPHDVLRLAWAVALGYASPHVATLGRDLVVVSGAEGGSLDISPLDARRLRNLCASSRLTYRRHIKKKMEEDAEGNEFEVIEEWEEPALPTMRLCGTALADPAIRLYRPVLAAITKVPVLRPDRTLLEHQGVDEATRMIYWPDLPVGTIPEPLTAPRWPRPKSS